MLPSESAAIVCGIQAARGQLSLGWVIVVAALGAFVGDNSSYSGGRWLGRLFQQRSLSGERAQENLDWAQRFLARELASETRIWAVRVDLRSSAAPTAPGSSRWSSDDENDAGDEETPQGGKVWA